MINRQRSIKDYLILYSKGIAMGAADVVPGVSGGTIAFITGIYEELIHSIKTASTAAQTKLLKLDITGFLKAVKWTFLIPLLAGVGTSVIILSKLVLYLLDNHPIPLWSFFFGLIVASTIVVYKKIKSHNIWIVLAAIVGAVFAFWITTISPAETRDDLWFIFICGAVAICAMILPGISGSFILLLMGKYQYILNALQEFKITIILTFIAGCVVGLSSFARVLDWLFKRYHDLTVALLAGFMVGSLNKVWPWKEVVTFITTDKGKIKVLEDRNVSPWVYSEITGLDSNLTIAIVLGIVGFLVVFLIEKGAKSDDPMS